MSKARVYIDGKEYSKKDDARRRERQKERAEAGNMEEGSIEEVVAQKRRKEVKVEGLSKAIVKGGAKRDKQREMTGAKNMEREAIRGGRGGET